jgi:hypothetical protein
MVFEDSAAAAVAWERACGIQPSFIVHHPIYHEIALLNIIVALEGGVVRAGRAVRAVTFGYLVRLVCVCDEGVVGAGGGTKLEVLSRRTRKVAPKIIEHPLGVERVV